MSARELERVEVMGLVAKEGRKLLDAAAMLELSYRQVKRLWFVATLSRGGWQGAEAWQCGAAVESG